MAIEHIIANPMVANIPGQIAAGQQFNQQQQMNALSMDTQRLANEQARYSLTRQKAKAPIEDLQNYLARASALSNRMNVLASAETEEERRRLYEERVLPFANKYLPEANLPENYDDQAVAQTAAQLAYDLPSMTEYGQGMEEVQRLVNQNKIPEAQALHQQLTATAQSKGTAEPIYSLDGEPMGMGIVLEDGTVLGPDRQPLPLDEITTQAPPKEKDPNKKAIPMGSLNVITGGIDAARAVNQALENVEVTGIESGLSQVGRIVGMDEQAQKFDEAVKSLRLSLQTMIKGNPSNRDLQVIIDQLPAWGLPDSVNRSRLEFIKKTIRNATRGTYAAYDPEQYYIPDEISSGVKKAFGEEEKPAESEREFTTAGGATVTIEAS